MSHAANQEQARPFVFVHIPKTAGTAFHNYLLSAFEDPTAVAPPFFGDYTIYRRGHTYRLYYGHMFFEKIASIVPTGRFLTFLRDPVARTISQYKSWSNPANFSPTWDSTISQPERDALLAAQRMTLEEFIDSDNPNIRAQVDNVQTNLLASGPPPSGSAALESAKRNLAQHFDFIGIVEEFRPSIALFQSVFGLEQNYTVPIERENRSPQSVGHISEGLRRKIESLNANDFELYEFGRSLFRNRLAATGLRLAS